ncbi:MAG: 30S ribosomal protein S14 [Gammaproteobacteria bacterium]
MAKKSMIAREKRRVLLSYRNKNKRNELRKLIADPNTSYEDKAAAVAQLNKRARDESACRVKNRCRRCGRPRAVYRRFALCRICLRQVAMHGDVPGLSKSSW